MEIKQYDKKDAQNISLFLQNQLSKAKDNNLTGVCNTNTYNLKQGILKYGKKGKDAINKELSQLHNREVFKPIMISDLIKEEQEKP